MQNLVVISHTVSTHVGGPQNWDGDAGAYPLETRSYSMCYRTKSGRSQSNHLGPGRGVQKNWGNAGAPPP